MDINHILTCLSNRATDIENAQGEEREKAIERLIAFIDGLNQFKVAQHLDD